MASRSSASYRETYPIYLPKAKPQAPSPQTRIQARLALYDGRILVMIAHIDVITSNVVSWVWLRMSFASILQSVCSYQALSPVADPEF